MEYSNWQRKYSNANFALIGCRETKIVEKVKALTFKTIFRLILAYGHKSCFGKASVYTLY